MLETVIEFIEEIPDISFTQYFQRYVEYVQDNSIQLELKSLKRNNPKMTIDELGRLLDKIGDENK